MRSVFEINEETSEFGRETGEYTTNPGVIGEAPDAKIRAYSSPIFTSPQIKI